VSGMSPPTGLVPPNVTLCVAPAICHVTLAPGATVIVAGEKLVPTVLTVVALGAEGVDGLVGCEGVTGVEASGATAAPPPPHAAIDKPRVNMTARFDFSFIRWCCA